MHPPYLLRNPKTPSVWGLWMEAETASDNNKKKLTSWYYNPLQNSAYNCIWNILHDFKIWYDFFPTVWALTRLKDPMPMLTPPLKWMCVLLSLATSFVTFAMAWHSLVGNTTYHLKRAFIMTYKSIISPTESSKPLTCKSDNCSGFSSLLWWRRLNSRLRMWELPSAAEPQHSTALHASLLLRRIKSHV